MKEDLLINLDKRVSLLEEKLTLYLEQLNNSLTRLEKTIAGEMAKSTESLRVYADILEKNNDTQKITNSELKKRIRKLEDEQLKLTSWRIIIIGTVPTILAIFSLLR